MIEAYAIGVAAKLEDDVTPALLRIIDGLTRANALMLDFSANVRRMSSAGLSLSRSLDKAVAGATALGDASASLTRASYVLDTMAASSADLARNMAVARNEGRMMNSGGYRPPSGGGSGGGYQPPGVAPVGGSGGSNSRFGRNAAGAVGISAAYGIYENARLQDLNIRSAATSQIPFPLWAQSADEMRAREFEYAGKYAFATGGRIAPFGEAMLESSRLLRTLKPADQKILTDAAMPYAAVEAKLKGVALPEAMLAFIGLAHQAGAYTPQAATPLFESMMQASLTTHASLGQISRAASYSLPALHASGANSSDVMMMLATMMQAGILNTKSGTWLNNMAMNALPNSLGSGLFSNKKQNEALQMLGLYKGNTSQFYKNGQFDLMQEVSILAHARETMDPLTFNAATRQAFGIQGQRAAALFAEPQVLSNLHMLSSMTSSAQSPFNVGQAVQTFSTVAKADQTIANANMTLMNASSTFMGPAGGALSGLSALFGWTAKTTAAHPIAGGVMDVGLGIGAAGLLGAAWKGGALGVDLIGKKLISPILGGLWKCALRAVSGLGVGALRAALGAAGVIEVGTATAGLGVAIAGAIGYGVGTIINGAMDWAIKDVTHGKESNLGGWIYDKVHPYNPNAAPAPTPHVTVQIDGEDVRHHIVHGMQVTPNRAATGVNPLRAPINPSLGWAPGL